MASEATVYAVDPKALRREDLREAARRIAEGGLVAFPTETVYAVGVRAADEGGRARLAGAIGGDPTPPVALFVPTVELALALAGEVPARVRPLLRRFWPGPLTVIFPGSGGAPGPAIRVPAHPVARELLELVGAPLSVVPAQRDGGSALVSGDAVRAALGDRVDAIVDGGETPLKEPSTIVRVSDRSWEVVRRGIVSEEMLARHLTTTVTFVCTGNSCRSPMAEVLLRRKLAARLKIGDDELEARGFRVLSAGTSAGLGGAASEGAVIVMQERAIDLSRHRTRPITQDLVEASTAVIALTPSHADTVERWWPEHRAKIHVLDEDGIFDPIGGPQDMYRECADLIEKRLEPWVEKLVAGDL